MIIHGIRLQNYRRFARLQIEFPQASSALSAKTARVNRHSLKPSVGLYMAIAWREPTSRRSVRNSPAKARFVRWNWNFPMAEKSIASFAGSREKTRFLRLLYTGGKGEPEACATKVSMNMSSIF